jgi:DNA-binding transcriptional LysR family regulator
MINLDSLSGLVAFATAVQSGGFASAGRRLGVSASAVGKAVSRLEVRLGVKLLQRSTRSIALTAEGEIMFSRAVRIVESVREAEGAISLTHDTARGRLKVSIPTVIGRHSILPNLPRFMAKYPEVDLDLRLDDAKVDIIEDGYDLVLRLGVLQDSSLIARKIGPHTFVTCASPAYLAAQGVPKTPADLVDHRCLRFRFPTTGLLEHWEFQDERMPKTAHPGIILNDGEALSIAARAGLGIIQVPKYQVIDDLASGHLLAVLQNYAVKRGDVWIIWPNSRMDSLKVRVFTEFLSNVLLSEP